MFPSSKGHSIRAYLDIIQKTLFLASAKGLKITYGQFFAPLGSVKFIWFNTVWFGLVRFCLVRLCKNDESRLVWISFLRVCSLQHNTYGIRIFASFFGSGVYAGKLTVNVSSI